MVFTFAQPKPLSNSVYQALNQYVLYANEVIHASNVMYQDFESINLQCYEYSKKRLKNLDFVHYEVLKNYEYYPILPEQHYTQIGQSNFYLSYAQRGKVLNLASALEKVINELEELRLKFHEYINQKKYLKDDPKLDQAYLWLRRAEVLYSDLYAIQDKLQWELENIYKDYQYTPFNPDYHRLLLSLAKSSNQARTLIKTQRQGDLNQVQTQFTKFKELLSEQQHAELAFLPKIPKEQGSDYCPHVRRLAFYDKAKQFSLEVDTVLSKPKLLDNRHSPSQQYYNFRLLRHFNRYGDGLVALWNKMVLHSGEFILLQGELPPYFEVLDPNVIIERDSNGLELPSFEGYAFNNLIFVLDVSSSMNDAYKLPLLKNTLLYLVSFMRPDDKISIIIYSYSAEILLENTPASDKQTIEAALNKIRTQPSTNADAGINLAYKLALRNQIQAGNNKILFATDGNIQVSKKTKKILKKHRNLIRLSTLYFDFKEDNNKRLLLEDLARQSGGNYRYMKPDNATQLLLEEARLKLEQ